MSRSPFTYLSLFEDVQDFGVRLVLLSDVQQSRFKEPPFLFYSCFASHITMNQVEQSSWTNPPSRWLLRNYLHREEHLQQEMVFISIRTKSSFLMSLSLPCARIEKGIDSGNPWLLLALSRTVWMMLCKFKNQV